MTLPCQPVVEIRLGVGANFGDVFILGDLESALADNNVLFEQFPVGTRLADLPSGSFTPVAYVDAPSPELAGTVKESKSAAYYILEADEKRRYIAPAKLVVYKVQ